MRNYFIILLWALLLACGIFAYSAYRHADQAEQALENRKSEFAALQGETARIKQKLGAAATTNKQLKASVQALETELRATREAAEQSMTRSKNLLAEIEQLNEALADKEGELVSLEAKYSQKATASAQTKTRKNRLFSELQKAHQSLSAQVDEAGAAIKRLQSREKALQSQLAVEKKASLDARAALDEISQSEAYLQSQLAEALRNQNKAASDGCR